LLGAEVSEIHRYPLRPSGFEEPLFPTASSKQSVIEHLLEAPWLSRASRLEGQGGGAVHALEEPVGLRKSQEGWVEIVRLGRDRKRCHSSWSRRRVNKIIDRWRQVGEWWDEDHRVDRMVFRIILSDGAVVDLARERSSGWFLVGVID
jgi:hypothetical protein